MVVRIEHSYVFCHYFLDHHADFILCVYFNHQLPATYHLLTVTNVFNSGYFPVSGYTTFDNTGAPYNASAIVGPTGLFDEQAYVNYSPVFMPITLALAYGVSFGSFTSVLVHTFCT